MHDPAHCNALREDPAEPPEYAPGTQHVQQDLRCIDSVLQRNHLRLGLDRRSSELRRAADMLGLARKE